MALLTTTPITQAAEFPDRLRAELLLIPDPEFLFTRWATAAQMAEGLVGQEGWDLTLLQMREGRLYGTGDPANTEQAMSGGMGGPLGLAPGLMYPDMFKVITNVGPGEVVKMNRPRFTDGPTTEANRLLSSSSTLFGNSFGITSDQVDVMIREYGGPTDPATGNVSALSIAEFTQHRSAHDLLVDFGFQLRRDYNKFLDDLIQTRLLAAAAATTTGTTRPQGVANNASFTGQGSEPFSFDLIVRAGEAMKNRYAPGVAGLPRYPMVADTHQIADLKLDPQYQRSAVFEPTMNVLFPGYVRTVENVILCESNRMQRLTNLGSLGNITGYQALMVAPNALGWAIAMDAMVKRDRNDDGGRFTRVAWNMFMGLAVLDERFVQVVISD